jgi:hypothetical protein
MQLAAIEGRPSIKSIRQVCTLAQDRASAAKDPRELVEDKVGRLRKEKECQRSF